MIISLEEAQKINPNISKDELLAYETHVRELTNNKFHHEHIKNHNLVFDTNTIICSTEFIGYKVGDTIEVIGSKYNDGLYVVEEVTTYTLTVNTEMIQSIDNNAMMIKIDYPFDIRNGVKELITYKTKMASKIGIKSESVARMSVTYFDATAKENTEGVPSGLYSFLNKYKKIKW